jgi:hypothetical protein
LSNPPDITIRLRPGESIPAAKLRFYGLAGRVVASDTAWPELEPFRIGVPGAYGDNDLPVVAAIGPPQGAPDRSVEGWVAEQHRRVSCRDLEDGCRVAVSGIGEFFVAGDGALIAALRLEPTASDAEIMMTLLGPPMILAMAAQEVWLLHAGAVERGGGAWLFLGRSGAGKSTLARQLSGRGLSGRRVGDDMVAVCVRDEGLWCLPAFPQLKLLAAEQVTQWRERIPLAGICVLEVPKEGAANSGFAVQRVAPAQMLHSLAGNTMGISLLDARRRQRHLGFLANVVEKVTLRRVVYPHRQQSIALLGGELALW